MEYVAGTVNSWCMNTKQLMLPSYEIETTNDSVCKYDIQYM